MSIDFSKAGGLVPAVIQDVTTLKVLMLGYMNEEALTQTRTSGKVTFFSRSKQRLWTKGESSGNFLYVKDIKQDCDNDTLLIMAEPAGPVCHTGSDTCFNTENSGKAPFLDYLAGIIAERRHEDPENSYTSRLFEKGLNKIAQKVGEEAVEIVIEAKDDNRDLFKGEAADLLFHFLVLLEAKQIPLDEVISVLQERHHK